MVDVPSYFSAFTVPVTLREARDCAVDTIRADGPRVRRRARSSQRDTRACAPACRRCRSGAVAGGDGTSCSRASRSPTPDRRGVSRRSSAAPAMSKRADTIRTFMGGLYCASTPAALTQAASVSRGQSRRAIGTGRDDSPSSRPTTSPRPWAGPRSPGLPGLHGATLSRPGGDSWRRWRTRIFRALPRREVFRLYAEDADQFLDRREPLSHLGEGVVEKKLDARAACQ